MGPVLIQLERRAIHGDVSHRTPLRGLKMALSTGGRVFQEAAMEDVLCSDGPTPVSCVSSDGREQFVAGLVDDTLAVRVDLDLLVHVREDNAAQGQQLPQPPASTSSTGSTLREIFARNMAELLRTGLASSDGLFVVDGQQFAVHRAIVSAQAPALSEMLYGGTHGCGAGAGTAGWLPGTAVPTWVVTGVTAAVFRLLLEFVYTGACARDAAGQCSLDEYMQLARTARRFELPALVVHCEERIAQRFCEDRVRDVLALAAECRLPMLQERCIEWMAANKALVRKPELAQSLSRECSLQLLQKNS
eukprot:m51a1_g11421 hypothetical protein (304) ;mRNA; f:5548-6459